MESIRRFLKRLQLKIYVIYNSSDESYEEGYATLKKFYPEVTFIKESISSRAEFLKKNEFAYWRNYYNFFVYPSNKGSSFKKNVNDILESGGSNLLFFLTDDSVFIETPCVTPEALEKIKNDPCGHMFSFRHGLNLMDTPAESLLEYDQFVHCKVDRMQSPHWTYKFSVDGHIYNKQLVTEMSSKIFYSNPNSFEAFLNTYSVKKNYFPNIFFNKSNSLVGFELNRVQTFSSNNNHNFSTNKLNAYFLRGYTLRYLFDVVNDFRPGLRGLEFTKNNDMFQISF